MENFAKNIVTLLDVHLVTWQGRKALSGAFNYNQVLPNMHLRFTLTFEKPDKTRMEMMDLMLNVCDYLNGSYDKLKIPRIVLHGLRMQEGIPKHCPIEAVSIGIHTYIIGHYNPSVSIINLVSHTTYVMCVNFIHKWRDLQFKVNSERQIF